MSLHMGAINWRLPCTILKLSFLRQWYIHFCSIYQKVMYFFNPYRLCEMTIPLTTAHWLESFHSTTNKSDVRMTTFATTWLFPSQLPVYAVYFSNLNLTCIAAERKKHFTCLAPFYKYKFLLICVKLFSFTCGNSKKYQFVTDLSIHVRNFDESI